MARQSKRTTVYLDPELHKALRLKAASISSTVSKLVNVAVRECLAEDAEDLMAFEERVSEPLVSYDEMVNNIYRKR